MSANKTENINHAWDPVIHSAMQMVRKGNYLQVSACVFSIFGVALSIIGYHFGTEMMQHSQSLLAGKIYLGVVMGVGVACNLVAIYLLVKSFDCDDHARFTSHAKIKNLLGRSYEIECMVLYSKDRSLLIGYGLIKYPQIGPKENGDPEDTAYYIGASCYKRTYEQGPYST
jgi:hypothetical protein